MKDYPDARTRTGTYFYWALPVGYVPELPTDQELEEFGRRLFAHALRAGMKPGDEFAVYLLGQKDRRP